MQRLGGRSQFMEDAGFSARQLRQQAQFDVAKRAIARNSLAHSPTPLSPANGLGLHERAGTCSRQLSSNKATAIGCGEETGVNRRRLLRTQRSRHPEQFGMAVVRFISCGRNARQTKGPPARTEGPSCTGIRAARRRARPQVRYPARQSGFPLQRDSACVLSLRGRSRRH
jgi:hypothetical protein